MGHQVGKRPRTGDLRPFPNTFRTIPAPQTRRYPPPRAAVRPGLERRDRSHERVIPTAPRLAALDGPCESALRCFTI